MRLFYEEKYCVGYDGEIERFVGYYKETKESLKKSLDNNNLVKAQYELNILRTIEENLKEMGVRII
ncbi:hypothetical protein H3018_gp14 [Bacillus phage DK3]|uniref:Uncharacterized protein n=1 Tax=Bacillus phage DK3 TaxID=2500810 RepID=A0A3T0IJ08_9CAUD|nr:hypothetical protein H3018_gp14 [Bacillus phage DK3]AZU99812.1 hypothetical protein DK3_000014 [Bacillus phage DK3]